MSTLTYHLTHDRFFLPDMLRDLNTVMEMAPETFAKSTAPVGVYDGEELMGVFFLTDITPLHQARLLFWGWGKWCPLSAVKNLRAYIQRATETYGLKRIYAQTPDRKLVKLLVLAGFQEEGRFKRAYKFGGKLYKLYQMRMLVGG